MIQSPSSLSYSASQWRPVIQTQPHITQVTSREGDVFPAAGCRLVAEDGSPYQRFELRIIQLNGEELVIESLRIQTVWGVRTPEWLVADRDKIAEAIREEAPFLDLRDDVSTLFPDYPRALHGSRATNEIRKLWYVEHELSVRAATIIARNFVTPEELLTIHSATVQNYRTAGHGVVEDVLNWQDKFAYLLK